jgi:hypothetical protein
MIIFRKIRDKVGWLRKWVVPLLTFGLKFKKKVALTLRRSELYRDWFHLPDPKNLTIEQWLADGDCEDKIIHVEPAMTVIKAPPATNEPLNHWYFEKNKAGQTDASFVLMLHGGSVYGHEGGQYLNKRGNYLWDAGLEHWTYFNIGFMETVFKLPKPKYYRGRVAVLAHPWGYQTFGHWMFDVLPRFGLIERTLGLESIDYFAVGHDNKAFQKRSFERIGIPEDKIIPFDAKAHIRADCIVLPSIAKYNNQHLQRASLEYLRRLYCPRGLHGRKRRIYISRKDASFRHLHQENELLDSLRKIGFEECVLTGKSQEEVAALFGSAEVVTGPSGSGFMNMVFCQPGCLVIEIFTPYFFPPFEWALAHDCQLHFACYFGDDRVMKPERPMAYTKNIDVDPADCFNFIKQLMEKDGLL